MTRRNLTLTTSVRARAKVNLRLDVLGLRQDRYHEIYTVMHTLELADQIELSLTLLDRSGQVTVALCTLPDLGIPPQSNLACRAARQLLAAWQAAGGTLAGGAHLDIRLHKAIPVAAGLGGGSADAAAVLRGLGALLAKAEGHPGRVNLAVIAEALGSDVPFFLQGGAAVAVGRGEALIPVPSTLDLPVVLLAPEFGVSAGDAYAWWDEDIGGRSTAEGDIAPAYTCRLGDPAVLTGGLVRNELTAVVARRFPLVGELILAAQQAGALASEMTGSGPVVYAVFADDRQAEQVACQLGVALPQVKVQVSRLDPIREAVAAVTVSKGER